MISFSHGRVNKSELGRGENIGMKCHLTYPFHKFAHLSENYQRGHSSSAFLK
jgi:hypothetical protein